MLHEERAEEAPRDDIPWPRVLRVRPGEFRIGVGEIRVGRGRGGVGAWRREEEARVERVR